MRWHVFIWIPLTSFYQYIPGWNVSNKTTAVLEFLLKLCTIDSCKENFAFNEHISWWQVYNPLQTDVFVV